MKAPEQQTKSQRDATLKSTVSGPAPKVSHIPTMKKVDSSARGKGSKQGK